MSDFLEAGNLDALAVLEGVDEFEQVFVGAGVESGIAAAHLLDEEVAVYM